jgi:hypothetical protein
MTELNFSERELDFMINDMVDAQAQAMPVLRSSLLDLQDQIADEQRGSFRASRRTIIMAGGLTVGGLALAACGSSSKKSGATGSGASTAPAAADGKLTGDFRVVGLAAALENAAVFAYGEGIKAATAGKLGDVPKVVVKFATTAMAQHKEHGLAWNGFLQSNGKKAITDIPLTIVPDVQKGLAAVKDVPGLATFALGLEEIAAATYITGAAGVSVPAGVATTLSIAPVEAQHAAILRFVLGKYPVPDALYNIKPAVGPDIFTG